MILESSHLVQGVTDSTMNHGEGWQFIQVGRFIERAAAIARLLDIYFREFPAGQPMDSGEHMEWIGLLRSCTAFEAYCKVYTADLRPDRVAEFLLLNSEFPHSVRFAADQMQSSLEAINQAAASKRSPRVAKIAGRLSAGLMFTPLEEVVDEPGRILRRYPTAMRPHPHCDPRSLYHVFRSRQPSKLDRHVLFHPPSDEIPL